MVDVAIQVVGLDEVIAKLGYAPPALRDAVGRAGKKYAPVLLDQQGVRVYPPTTQANQPPVPYYIRGTGTQYANFNKGESQQYNKRWATETRGLRTIIANSATYAKYLGGTYAQARRMASIGWKKLIDAAKDTQAQMKTIYSIEIDRALRLLRLK